MKSFLLTGLTAALAACTPATEPVAIPFEARYQGAPVACAAEQARAPQDLALTDLRFYLYGVEVGTDDGNFVPVRLQEDGKFQTASVALIDLEDGDGACLNGSAETNATLRIAGLPAAARGLRFRVGLPRELNHANPLTAAPPLNFTSMHWHWISGYKFLRAGVETADDGFWLHLGSTRCEGTMQDIRGCAAPNQVTVELPNFQPGRDSVVIDLAALFDGVDFDDASAGRCMSGPGESACQTVFTALGLLHESSANAGRAAPATQRVFRLSGSP